MSRSNFDVEWREDGIATVVGRITSKDGTGVWTGNRGEGNWVKIADLSSITYAAFEVEIDNDGVSTVVAAGATGTVTISSSVLDTPRTSSSTPTMDALWSVDQYGYNFLHDLPAATFPTGAAFVRVEYKFTFSGGAVGWGVFEGPVRGVHTS